MGATICCPIDEAEKRSRELDRRLETQRQGLASEEMLLLLGAGECGKSTVVKQMRVIYANGFTAQDKDRYRMIIRDNLIRSMAAILIAMKNLGIEFQNESLEEESTLVRDFQSNYDPRQESIFPESIIQAVTSLWADEGVQSCYRRSSEYQLIDSAKYFIEKIDKVAEKGYIPSKDDIIRAREQTQGIVEIEIVIRTSENTGKFRIIDVGGQRSQRKKWMHSFDDVTALIFVASLNDYDLILQEDSRQKTNRMVESLILFETTIHMQTFKQKNVVLFLNKTDLFREKVLREPIGKYFPDYSGGPDYKKGCDYFTAKFLSKNANDCRKIYPHLTCATDTEALGHLINVVADTIIQQNLIEVGLA